MIGGWVVVRNISLSSDMVLIDIVAAKCRDNFYEKEISE